MQKIHSFSRRYQEELRERLRGSARRPSQRAEDLGNSAISGGFETLSLARIHGQALLALMPVDCTDAVRAKTMRRAGAFYLDALAPVERTRRALIDGAAELKHSNAALKKRTVDLLAANKRLKAEVNKKGAAERLLRLSEKNYRLLLSEASQMQVRLRRLSHQVLLAQEEERKEISRELHDEIVQTLTGINVQLATLKLEAGANKKSLSKHISYTQRLVERSVDIVHQFARGLRPTLLDDLGLIPALHAYLKAYTRRTGLQVGFSTFAGVEKLGNDKRTVLYRVAQAALMNISQHAAASIVSVAIKSLPDAVLMEIKDNGRSFDSERILRSRKTKQLGLIGMRERVEMVGGTFKIDSAPRRGTMISALLPCKRRLAA